MSCDCEEKSVEGKPLIGLIVCGPCACGKSEVASALAKHYQVPYVDADTYHSETNIKKMSTGIPLTDEDRFPWLATVRQEMILQKKHSPITPTETQSQGSPPPQVVVVGACSALTQKYRNILQGKEPNSSTENPPQQADLSVIFVFLNCSKDVLQKRLNERQGHFMKGNMLSSQLATLEVPHEEARQGQAIIVNGDADLPSVIKEATQKLQAIITSLTPK